ncbi:hypothetical protein HID58_092721, partial [Brassica napus]
ELASFSWKNLKYHLLMDPDGVAAASTFYNTVFGAVLKKSFTLAQVELKLARNFLWFPTQIQLAVDVKAVMDAAITRGALNQTELITESEASRGIVAKLRDPFGYNWAFSHRSNQSDDICSLCFMDAPHHTSINFCTLPHTRRWLIAASHTPPNVTEEDMANKLFKIYLPSSIFSNTLTIGRPTLKNIMVFNRSRLILDMQVTTFSGLSILIYNNL